MPNTHANTFSDRNRDSYSDGNCNAYGHTNGYSELHAQPDSHAEVSTYGAAAPDACAASVVGRSS